MCSAPAPTWLVHQVSSNSQRVPARDSRREVAGHDLMWPVYGALIVNLRNILDATDEVAVLNPLSPPPLPFARVQARVRTGPRPRP